jgi:hypothetical protein
MSPEEPLWNYEGALFRKLFREIVDGAGYAAANFTPASLRAGGTTHYFLSGVALDRLQYWGRWAAAATMKAYVQEVGSHLVWLRISDRIHHQTQFRLNAYRAQLNSPPSTPFQALISCRRSLHA